MAANDREKQERKYWCSVVRRVMETESGRDLVSELLRISNFHHTVSWDSNEHVLYFEGGRRVGAALWKDCLDAAPESTIKMMREERDRNRRRSGGVDTGAG